MLEISVFQQAEFWKKYNEDSTESNNSDSKECLTYYCHLQKCAFFAVISVVGHLQKLYLTGQICEQRLNLTFHSFVPWMTPVVGENKHTVRPKAKVNHPTPSRAVVSRSCTGRPDRLFVLIGPFFSLAIRNHCILRVWRLFVIKKSLVNEYLPKSFDTCNERNCRVQILKCTQNRSFGHNTKKSLSDNLLIIFSMFDLTNLMHPQQTYSLENDCSVS